MKWETRNPERSPEERELDAAMREYEHHFGEPFVMDFAANIGTMSETIAEIRKLIAEDRRQTTPEYKKGAVY